MIEKQQGSMRSTDIQELYYIVAIQNLASIYTHGILAKNKVQNKALYRAKHDIANQQIQRQRDRLIISPETKTEKNLHDYVSLFIQPYNAMLLTIQNTTNRDSLCILRINKTILHDRVKDAILSDRNTACYEAKFFKAANWALSPNSSKAVQSRKLSGSSHYISSSEFQTLKQKRQLEAMFFEKVPPQFITGIIVPSQAAHTSASNSLAIHSLTRTITIHTEPTLFPKPGPGVFNNSHAVLDFMDDIEAEADQPDRKRIRY